jgi:hypothetical protein
MIGGDLRVLAEKYVVLTGEIEDVRRAMLACLANGAEPKENPTRAKRPGAKGPQHPNAIAAQQAEMKIVELLRETPGLKSAQIAKATGAKANTVTERLKRLKARHLITPAEGGGWTAAASA